LQVSRAYADVPLSLGSAKLMIAISFLRLSSPFTGVNGVCLHRTSMHENHRISLRENTKRIEDTIRRCLGGRAGEIRSGSRKSETEASGRCAEVHPGMFQKETCCRTM